MHVVAYDPYVAPEQLAALGVETVLEGSVRVTIGNERDWFHVDRVLGRGETFGEIESVKAVDAWSPVMKKFAPASNDE